MEKWAMLTDPEKQMSALRYQAIGLLARREQSRGELRRKLYLKALEKGWSLDLEYLLDELQRQGLQSDLRFSEVLVRSKANAGYGPLRLYQWGVQYGLERELVHDQIVQQQYDWFEQALRQKQKHCGAALATSLREKSKQARYLYQRGFSQEQIHYALNTQPAESH
jgi:regulatory protein